MPSPRRGVSEHDLPTSVQHILCANKATAIKDLQKSHILHMRNLKNMKAAVDNKFVNHGEHLKNNGKRLQMEAERNATIERENKILLGKVTLPPPLHHHALGTVLQLSHPCASVPHKCRCTAS